MLPKQHLSIKKKTNDYFLRNLLKNTPFIVISYKNNINVATNGVKTITKNQICSSLSGLINKKTEKFPLNLNTFDNVNTLYNYLNTKNNFIISVIKIKNTLFKGINKIKKINLLPLQNITALHSILIRKYLLFKVLTDYLVIEK